MCAVQHASCYAAFIGTPVRGVADQVVGSPQILHGMTSFLDRQIDRKLQRRFVTRTKTLQLSVVGVQDEMLLQVHFETHGGWYLVQTNKL